VQEGNVTGPRKTALRVASAYAAIALGWILLSDLLVSALPQSVVPAAQSAKGVLFVIVTAVVIFLYVERYVTRAHSEEERSRTVERMLVQVVSTVPVGVLLTGDDGTISFLNSAAEKMLGTTVSDAIGSGIDELLSPDHETGSALMTELMRTGGIEDLPLGQADAPTRSVLARAAEIDPSLPASGWVIAIADVTEAHRAQAAIESQLASYRFLAQGLSAAVTATDRVGLLGDVARAAVQSGRYCAAWAVVVDERVGGFTEAAAVGMGPRTREVAGMMRERASVDASAMPFEAGAVVVGNDILRDPANVWYPAALEEGYGSSATIGLGEDGELAAGITLFARESGAFDAREVETIEALVSALTDVIADLVPVSGPLIAE
jgi:PAS domain S-box-containing protein